MLDRTNVILSGDCLGANFLSLEFTRDVGIDGAESVHLRQLFRLDETDLELFEFLLDLSRHKDDLVGGFGA